MPPGPMTFARLWAAHPANHGIESPCRSASGEPHFDNQCAIKMGVALEGAGVSLRSFRGARCWYGHRHILRAQELADWLKKQVRTFGKVAILGEASAADYHGRTGIVFFRNFWGTGNQGDHIDVWDGGRMGGGDDEYFERAQQVWFWQVG